jgi:signal transduction histidine kinase
MTLAPAQLQEAFEAFTAASSQLEAQQAALRSQLDHVQGDLEGVLAAVPFAIWVLGSDGAPRFTNRPEGLAGRFLDGPAPWEASSPGGPRRFQTSDGHERHLEEERRATTHGAIIVTLRDVTEAVLRAQQDRREDRLAAMGRVAAELAHEIRNPLGSLALHAGVLAQDLEGQPSHEVARHLQEGVARLDRLVANTLAFSRDLKPRMERVPLRALWSEALLPQAAACAVEIPLEAAWRGDGDLLRQVAQNLLQNARRATEDVGAPQLRLTATEEVLEGRRWWRVSLADNGCGIAPEALARVFDPFFSAFGGGTGLGLSVCHRIVVAHGGLLFLESGGRGTTVHVRLEAHD